MSGQAEPPPPPIGGATLVFLSALTSLGGLVTGIYLPAFPAMASDFGTDAAGVQATFTTYLVGFGLGQVVFGPIADRFGRRDPLIVASVLCLLSSIAVAASPNLAIMAVFRFFQAVGAAGGVVIARAVVSDSTTGFTLARTMNIMISMAMFAPVVSPLAGSLLLAVAPWQVAVWAIVPIAMISLVGVYFHVPDSLRPDLRTSRVDYADLVRVFRSRRFAGFLVVSAAATGALMAYTGASPFIFQTVLRFSEVEYGILYAINALGMVGAAYLSAKLAHRGVQPSITLGAGIVVMFIAAGAAFVVPEALLPVVLFISAANHGLITGNAAALALPEVRAIGGSGSAALGGAQFLTGALTASMVGAMGAASTLPYLVTIAACAVTAAIGFVIGTSGPSSAADLA